MQRRRGRDTGHPELLLERDAERSLIEAHLDDAAQGRGGVALIEGPAGTGKSRLINLAGDAARARGYNVLGAYGAELERDFPFGIAIQLFEPWWLAADGDAREAVMRAGAGAAVRLLTQGPPSQESDEGYGTIHGLFRLMAHVAEANDSPADGATVLLVDDAHWADGPSLRALAYLGSRIGDLPVAIVATSRAGEPATDPQALAALRRAAGPSRLRLKSLSAAATEAVVTSQFPDADAAFCTACLQLTNGNPFLLIELLEQIRGDGRPPNETTAARLGGLAPEAVLDAVVARLGSQPPEVGAVARATAVLGDGAPVSRVARLAKCAQADAVRAADTLAQMHLLCPGEPLSFVHPLIRSAVEQSMSPLNRGLEHLRAARILSEEAAPAEAVAPHLLAAPAESDARSAEILREAARTAMASGAAASAVRMLRRALTEGASGTSADLLAELAEAEAACGLGDSVRRLEQAIDASSDPHRRGELALTEGTVLHRSGESEQAAKVLRRALQELTDHDSALGQDLAAMFVSAASLVPAHTDETHAVAERILTRRPEDLSSAQREALAHLALHEARHGRPQEVVRQMADRAWSDGRLLEDEADSEASWPLLSSALFAVDELERDIELCGAVIAHAAKARSATQRAIANLCRAWPLYERAEIAAAADSARAAVDALPVTGPSFFWTAYGTIALCHLQRGQLQEAATALAIIEHPELRSGSQLPWLLLSRAQLRLAQRQPEAALNDATTAGERWESMSGSTAAAAFPWRSVAAQAQLALGQSAQAHQLVSQEMVEAEATGVRRVVIRDLRIIGLVEGGRTGLERLEAAAQLGAAGPQRLEHVATLIALGGALRRANQRAAAREPLLEAITLSQRGGATALAQQANDELRATGARPRSTARWGPDALTPSERRVAELAADGLTTRAMAESLFVTPKTVEYHLRHIYQKLGVNSRDRLAAALRDGA